jgi:glycosyltransferase involved in cell wall biosynthesis
LRTGVTSKVTASEMLGREGGIRRKGTVKKSGPGRPLVSVITVVHNGEKHLEQAILSVLGQTYDNLEYIIVDGGSTDGTLDIIKKYDDRIDSWISEPDRGISDAMNKGIRLATGDLIAHLHADDYYSDPSVISSVCSEYLRHKDVLWLTGGIDIVDRNGKILQEIPVRKYSYRKLIRGNFILHPATFVTRRAFEKAGCFNEEYRYAMDYDLWIRIGGIADPVTLDLQVACFRAHPESRSIIRSDMAYHESWMIRKKQLEGHHGKLFYHYLYYTLCKRLVRAYYVNLLSGKKPSLRASGSIVPDGREPVREKTGRGNLSGPDV